jgi:hypothetical protein
MQNHIHTTPMKNEIGGVSFRCLVSNDQINFESKPCKAHYESNPKCGLFAEQLPSGKNLIVKQKRSDGLTGFCI